MVNKYGEDSVQASIRGDYGTCSYCGEPLDRNDVAAQKSATTNFEREACISCKIKSEINDKFKETDEEA